MPSSGAGSVTSYGEKRDLRAALFFCKDVMGKSLYDEHKSALSRTRRKFFRTQ